MLITQLQTYRFAGSLTTSLHRPERPVGLFGQSVLYSQYWAERFGWPASFDELRVARLVYLFTGWIVVGRADIAGQIVGRRWIQQQIHLSAVRKSVSRFLHQIQRLILTANQLPV